MIISHKYEATPSYVQSTWDFFVISLSTSTPTHPKLGQGASQRVVGNEPLKRNKNGRNIREARIKFETNPISRGWLVSLKRIRARPGQKVDYHFFVPHFASCNVIRRNPALCFAPIWSDNSWDHTHRFGSDLYFRRRFQPSWTVISTSGRRAKGQRTIPLHKVLHFPAKVRSL